MQHMKRQFAVRGRNTKENMMDWNLEGKRVIGMYMGDFPVAYIVTGKQIGRAHV